MKLENALSSPNVCFPNTKEGRKAEEMALVVVSRSPHPHKDRYYCCLYKGEEKIWPTVHKRAISGRAASPNVFS